MPKDDETVLPYCNTPYILQNSIISGKYDLISYNKAYNSCMQTPTLKKTLTPEQARAYLRKRTREEADVLENMLQKKRDTASMYV